MGSPTEAASNVEWKQWGETDPFFGVASWTGRQQGGENPWTTEEFYALGSKDWAEFRPRWDSYERGRGTCVEIGCGVGRLTMHMANDFERVIGVDVSDGMLRVARAHVTAPSVEFRLGNGVEIPAPDACADGVFSAHVFQHFDSFDLARANFAEAARVLRPGASAMIHLPMHQWPRGLAAMERVLDARQWLGGARARVRRRRGKPLMRGLTYSWEWLFHELPELGFSNIEIVVFPTSSNDAPHPCVLMRRT